MNPRYVTYLIVAILAVLILWMGFGFFLPLMFPTDPVTAAEFGDGFGSVNTLFSGLGFVALIWTILIQFGQRAEEMKNANFNVMYSLYSEIKRDFEHLGPELLLGDYTSLAKAIDDEKKEGSNIKNKLQHLLFCMAELDFFLDMLETKSKVMRSEELHIIAIKVKIIHVALVRVYLTNKKRLTAADKDRLEKLYVRLKKKIKQPFMKTNVKQ